MEHFKEIREEILRRAKAKGACVAEYIKALEATTLQELAKIVKDNFVWACDNKIIDVEFIDLYKADFREVEIYANESISSGYVVIDGEVEKLSGNAVAYMLGNSTVTEMWGNSTVTKMWGNSTVTEMWENSYISTYNYIECKISENAIMRVRNENKIYTNTTVEKPKS